MHKTTYKIYKVLQQTEFTNTMIYKIQKHEKILHVSLGLPKHKDLKSFKEITPNLCQELNALDVKINKVTGKLIELHFGYHKLDNQNYSDSLLNEELTISFPDAFGYTKLDFLDGASCHLLNGGSPRMGKTTFLLYVSTMLYIQNKGNIKLYINSVKAKDFYPFDNLPNVTIAYDSKTFEHNLDRIITTYKRRNKLLYSHKLAEATDAKSVKELYPEKYHLYKPIFLIIDEYGRFSDNPKIQRMVEEIVETAGFVNVHVILSTQRPDARTVLTPRIKQGLQARICFRVPDKHNSIVILDREGAEDLPTTKGRAILVDGEPKMIQVPNMDYTTCKDLLKPYQKENNNHEKSGKRQLNNQVSSTIQNMFKESTIETSFQSEQQPHKRMQQSNEKTITGWDLLASPSIKR